MKMKKMIVGIAAFAIASMFMIGCDNLPTPEKMTAVSTIIGRTAGYACELAKAKPEVKTAILQVLDVASKVVPAEGQTFTEAWAPVIDEEVKKLIDAGKLNDTTAIIAKVALAAATEGLKYVFVKYPKAKDVKELVSAAVEGFTTGFKSVVSLAADAKPEIDEEAYSYIKSKIAK